jgi:hypothetical protein
MPHRLTPSDTTVTLRTDSHHITADFFQCRCPNNDLNAERALQSSHSLTVISVTTAALVASTSSTPHAPLVLYRTFTTAFGFFFLTSCVVSSSSFLGIRFALHAALRRRRWASQHARQKAAPVHRWRSAVYGCIQSAIHAIMNMDA